MTVLHAWQSRAVQARGPRFAAWQAVTGLAPGALTIRAAPICGIIRTLETKVALSY
jgi:hypothetical protein